MIELDQFMQIRQELEKYHVIFSAVWEIGKPSFTDSIKTAGIAFNSDGHYIDFLFNQDYWNKITEYQRKFVISHECLHVILNHGIRTKDIKSKMASNIAIDIVVNHALIDKFGFKRDKLQDNLCWMDVVFPDEEILPGMNFEYYYNLLKEREIYGIYSLDNHEMMKDSDWEEAHDSLNNNLTNEEKRKISNTIDRCSQSNNNFHKAETEKGNWLAFVDTKPVAKKRKWETVIKKWSSKFLKEDFVDLEQWARLNRRLESFPTDLMLPSEMEVEYETRNDEKIQVYFFQDTSGSCYKFRDRFFKAAKSLPPERFDVKLFCFDTQVYPTSIESGKLYGFGGTRYDIIESYIQRNMKLTGEPYPESIFIISDGFSNKVNPRHPERWHFFLSTKFFLYVPVKSHVFKLADYE